MEDISVTTLPILSLRTKYHVEKSEDGYISKITKGDSGTEVLIDGNNQEFCDFLSWASLQQRPVAHHLTAMPRPSVFFADRARFEKHCLDFGVVLNVVTHLNQQGDSIPSLKVGLGKGVRENLKLTHNGKELMFCYIVSATQFPEPKRPGMPHASSSSDPCIFITEEVLRSSNQALTNEQTAIRRFSSWPIERSFVYLDVSDFSKYSPTDEIFIINSIVRLVRDWSLWKGKIAAEARWALDSQICIGDGYIYVFKNSTHATYFAAHLGQLIEVQVAQKKVPVDFHFRMGVHHGPVHCFADPGRKGWNYIGDGINGGQRVLSAVGKSTDDVIFISGQVRQEMLKEMKSHEGEPPYPQILASLQNRGRKADKHGKLWRVYEVNHTDLTSKFSS